MHKRTFVFIAIVVMLIATIFIAGRLKRNSSPSINLSLLELKDLNGNEIIVSQFIRKPLVVNFWGTWCGPCLQEFAAFEREQKKYSTQINFLMISDEPTDKIKKFQEKNNYPFLFAHSQKIFDDFGITSVPVTCFYDGNGKLFTTKRGALAEEDLKELIKNILKP
ncbi:TlpA disulfide reductase family protein [Ferruginibacter sp.]|uniref:TlpA family protein disulfide reductase n=1 Tax=Ferruginibacter sp. TaxID=1940288 RepID=UPI00265A2C87|nr:TlpA disulfide reductase family protein [Ferruginibacter sp.]